MAATVDSLRSFWSHLASGLEGGRPLLAVLEEAGSECDSPEVSEAVADVAEMVARGTMLSEALEAQPRFFGPGAVHVIRGGEYLGLMGPAARLIADAAEQCSSCAGWQGEQT